MPLAHLYIFSDACPTDWLIDGHDDEWHTIVNWVFQSDPALQPLIDQGATHDAVLRLDGEYTRLIDALRAELKSPTLKKWRTGAKHKQAFTRAIAAIIPNNMPLVSACSFQEKTLRRSSQALLNSYNRRIGGVEGRGIAFEEFIDDKGRRQMKHSFVNFHGYHEIQAPTNQMLVLLLMSWFIGDQYNFYATNLIRDPNNGFSKVGLTVVSDRLSGDDDARRGSEMNLRSLIDPEHENIPFKLTRSATSDTVLGDLFVDNLAGFLNAAISEPLSDCGRLAQSVSATGVWTGSHQLVESDTELTAVPALARLSNLPQR